VSHTVAEAEMELTDVVDDIAEQQVSTQSWSDQMDAVDAATVSMQQMGNTEVKQTAAATEHEKETVIATEPEQETATAEEAVVVETMTTALVATATTGRPVDALVTDNDADFITVYSKRSHSSPT